ncbi:MAG: hypothetical protein A3G25_03175 [Betaproteobacteria bacterium RIFCSPLOWO2_12_FULL_63_13]|nr:MAG: hypothetical protein A3G25_03175 [Betaproteobacteria bacterium RIFCSPLOWO2_12_FULL_63_13]
MLEIVVSRQMIPTGRYPALNQHGISSFDSPAVLSCPKSMRVDSRLREEKLLSRNSPCALMSHGCNDPGVEPDSSPAPKALIKEG